MDVTNIRQLIEEYLALFPDEKAKLTGLVARLSLPESFNDRKSFSGHGTGGAIVLSPDRKKILMINHIGLQKWLQPGGHWDPEDDFPWQVAQREVEEETNIRIAERLTVPGASSRVPIDIDAHAIPASSRKNEPEHIHYDFRYIFVAADEALAVKEDEVADAEWVVIGSSDPRLVEVMPSIRKMQHLKLI